MAGGRVRILNSLDPELVPTVIHVTLQELARVLRAMAIS